MLKAFSYAGYVIAALAVVAVVVVFWHRLREYRQSARHGADRDRELTAAR